MHYNTYLREHVYHKILLNRYGELPRNPALVLSRKGLGRRDIQGYFTIKSKEVELYLRLSRTAYALYRGKSYTWQGGGGAGTHLMGEVGETEQQEQQQQQGQAGMGGTGGRRVDGGRRLTAWGRNVQGCIWLTLSFAFPCLYWRES